MKAIIIDYCTGNLLLLPIPKDRENDADDFVRSHPAYDDSCCYHMVNDGDTFDVYNVVEDGVDENGDTCYDYQHVTTI